MRTKGWATRVAATLLLAVGVVAAPAGPASAAVNVAYNFWTWNVAGAKINAGSTTNGMIGVAARSIVNRDADFAVFNEICQTQFNALIAELRELGYPQDSTNFARFTPATPKGACAPGDAKGPFGNAIFSRYPLDGAQRWTLTSDTTGEIHSLTCVNPTAQPKMHFCGTHITAEQTKDADGNLYSGHQLADVLGQLEAFNNSGHTAVLAGDLNAQPHYGRLNGFYSSSLNVPNNSGNTGAYRELDDNDSGNCLGYGEWTATRPNVNNPTPCGSTLTKIDHIFARQSRIVGSYSGDSLGISTDCAGNAATSEYPAGSCSDHRIVIGSATVSIG
ncbi:endonuclease/exonuclease/phosphatase family protein [Actinoplanes regularis]|uniref:Endonuclease/Exonuclease/phosphatase family protein n=1 Tax=Actinoplanes regularis TaxID=52697 RepID=A0A238ZLN2_9ACTN|nr:endonuclease/exonuclease/phosphatase family protein [Actinoplanes regularis]GIE87615.1 hypothetical protein Are01nite_40950 [Actinoplanes regularis]SNR83971.1 Endonuclease/Exonuclease/phosphatase family protein [Actinoplanes regularis]